MISLQVEKYETSDLTEAIKKMKSFWKAFIRKQSFPKEELRPDILKSWQRCLNLQSHPENYKPTFSNLESIEEKIREHQEYITAIEPIVQSVSELISASNHIIAFVDPDGYILKIYGNHEIQEIVAVDNFKIGANWNERFVGTTAVGITLETGQPSHVTHAEHYFKRFHQFSCTAVPIKDPFSQKMIGILDLVAYARDHQPHSMGMALQMARCVELEIYRARKEREDLFREYSTQLTLDQMDRGIIILDDQERIHRANLKAMEYLEVESHRVFNHKLHSINYFSNWHDKDTPYYFKTPKGNHLRLTQQPVFHQRRVIGALILIEKAARPARSVVVNEKASEPIGKSPIFLKILEAAKNIAQFDSNVLIMGETGTGKEVIARYIHENSARYAEPILAINCGSIPRELLGSELFGYEAGAFTGAHQKGHASKFELSNNGTLLLDEISEMPLESQVYLLRVIEEKAVTRLGGSKSIPVNIRIIASSNKDLHKEVEEGRFRKDLLFRLNVLSLNLPSLKERKQDIPLLAEHFLEKLSLSLGKKMTSLSKDAIMALTAYDWPGNVRELRNAIEQAIVFAEGRTVQLNHLPEKILRVFQVPENISDVEQEKYVKFMQVFNETGRNISKTARCLNVSRPTVYSWLKKYKIDSVRS